MPVIDFHRILDGAIRARRRTLSVPLKYRLDCLDAASRISAEGRPEVRKIVHCGGDGWRIEYRDAAGAHEGRSGRWRSSSGA